MKSRKQLKLAVTLLFVGVCGMFFLKLAPELSERRSGEVEILSGEEPETENVGTAAAEEAVDPPDQSEASADTGITVKVHVCGAVVCEGVYELAADARVVDALEAAGGMTADAAGAYLNLAALLTDGMRIYVPTEEEASEGGAGTLWSSDATGEGDFTGASGDGRVDLNRADKAELMTLPGIGESKAEAILSYREEHGSFRTVEEVMQVPGIKEGVFRKIEQKITVSGG